MYTLPDVWIRPPFGGKGRKMTGQLEAHANGFRYTSPKGEQLDIMYRRARPLRTCRVLIRAPIHDLQTVDATRGRRLAAGRALRAAPVVQASRGGAGGPPPRAHPAVRGRGARLLRSTSAHGVCLRD